MYQKLNIDNLVPKQEPDWDDIISSVTPWPDIMKKKNFKPPNIHL